MIIYFIAPAGLGIFTGIDLQPEEAVAEPDIVIPFHDVSIKLSFVSSYVFVYNIMLTYIILIMV